MLRLLLLLLAFLLPSGDAMAFSHGRGPQTFYVSNGGNDSNNGLSPNTAWATPGKVNGSHFNSGDTVAFDGGSTFSAGLTLSQANAPAYLTLTSFNAGQPTFNTGNSNYCVLATFFPGLTINNLNCVGGGDATSTTEGIRIENAQPDGVHLQGPTITNSTVSQYGWTCIDVTGFNTASNHAGFANVIITGNTVHDCGLNGSSTAIAGSGIGGGIYVNGNSQLIFNNNNVGVTITNNTVFNIPGYVSAGSFAGGLGIVAQESALIVIEHNLVHDGGSVANGNGPAGIIVTNTDGAIISFNEIYNWSHGAGGGDGFGIDTDVFSTNSLIEYNYSHDNINSDITLFGSPGPSTIRFNVTDASVHGESGIGATQQSGNASIYNNTVVTSGVDCFVFNNTTTSVTYTFANNICFSTSFVNPGVFVLANFAGSSVVFTGNDYYTPNSTPNFNINGTIYTSLAAMQAAGFEKVSGSPVGTTANPNLTGTFPPGNCGGYNGTCPAAYDLSSSSPAGKGNGLNLNTIYGYNVGTQDFYGNAVTNTTLPIGAAANK